jgi:hypothetical protein
MLVDPATKKLQPLLFCSRSLTVAQQKYSTIEKECLAIVYLVTRGRHLIRGPLIIQPDHSNLQFLLTSVNPRVQRWRVALSEFDYTIVYRRGSENHIGDFLSRAVPNLAPASCNESDPPSSSHPCYHYVPSPLSHGKATQPTT